MQTMNYPEETLVQAVTRTRRRMLCPKCKHGILDRIPRGTVVKSFLGFLPLRRYICYRCFRKVYVWHDQQMTVKD
jgi:DNA-directed RNA polymerase subunit RPC12/RpoP